jgi:hypothetical protein
VLILFPWDPVARLFSGERIWLASNGQDLADRQSLTALRAAGA